LAGYTKVKLTVIGLDWIVVLACVTLASIVKSGNLCLVRCWMFWIVTFVDTARNGLSCSDMLLTKLLTGWLLWAGRSTVWENDNRSWSSWTVNSVKYFVFILICIMGALLFSLVVT